MSTVVGVRNPERECGINISMFERLESVQGKSVKKIIEYAPNQAKLNALIAGSIPLIVVSIPQHSSA